MQPQLLSHHHDSILTRFPDLFDLLSEQSSNNDFATNVVEAATSVCQHLEAKWASF